MYKLIITGICSEVQAKMAAESYAGSSMRWNRTLDRLCAYPDSKSVCEIIEESVPDKSIEERVAALERLCASARLGLNIPLGGVLPR